MMKDHHWRYKGLLRRLDFGTWDKKFFGMVSQFYTFVWSSWGRLKYKNLDYEDISSNFRILFRTIYLCWSNSCNCNVADGVRVLSLKYWTHSSLVNCNFSNSSNGYSLSWCRVEVEAPADEFGEAYVSRCCILYFSRGKTDTDRGVDCIVRYACWWLSRGAKIFIDSLVQ